MTAWGFRWAARGVIQIQTITAVDIILIWNRRHENRRGNVTCFSSILKVKDWRPKWKNSLPFSDTFYSDLLQAKWDWHTLRRIIHAPININISLTEKHTQKLAQNKYQGTNKINHHNLPPEKKRKGNPEGLNAPLNYVSISLYF